MLGAYLSGAYDLENSYVIGDRESDVELAQNLGAKSVLFGEGEATLSTNSWNEIYRFLRKQERCSRVVRETAETKIEVSLALDGSGESDITTGLGFFDHMLEQIAKHAGCNLRIVVEGDLHVDEHHTIEDTAIALGEAVANCLENKQGIARYGFLLPMDDCLAQVALDFCSRPAFVWDAVFSREKVGEMPTEMFSHFFKSFSDAARCNLQISAQGENEHHKIEAIFKGFARSLRQAWYLDYAEQVLPSTKGSLSAAFKRLGVDVFGGTPEMLSAADAIFSPELGVKLSAGDVC
ncbi:UNVERIFIED_CONTAM: hypothetical protein GTU68_005861 [Idotea baltica]|nr:hypothetical protein [Idotea baltica]